jgi:formylglycine-generating enzyme required for sulfatase activity
MHGNAAEWTQEEGTAVSSAGKQIVRGGSWSDRPRRARSSFRLAYQSWQRVYNVGFRVACAVASDRVVRTAE